MRESLLIKLRNNVSSHRSELFRKTPVVFEDPLYPVPMEWQAIIEYLYQTGTLRVPHATFDNIIPDEPKIYALRLWAAPSPGDGGNSIVEGGYSRGVSHDFTEAISKVIGEFLERYTQTVYRNKDLYRASIADMRKKKKYFLDLSVADQWSDWQKNRFPSRRFDDCSIFQWVQGRSLTRKKSAYIPAQMVYMNYRFIENEPIVRRPISNGAGGMFTYEEAVLSGLHELIQRDAFLFHWLTKQAPAKIDPKSLRNAEIMKCLADFARYKLECVILDTTHDLCAPSFVAVLLDRTGVGPAVTLGGGCGFDQEKAILRAMTEAIGVRSWLRTTRQKRAEPLPRMSDREPFTEDWGPTNRLLLWYGLETIPLIEPFLAGKEGALDRSRNKSFVSPQEEIDYLVEEFKKRGDGYEIFVYKAKHKILDDLGYVSVRVCVPAILPLYLMETYAPIGSKRLEGYEVNTLPQPFP